MKRKMSVLALCLAAVLTITGLSAGKVQASPKVYTGNNQNNISYLTIDYSESYKSGKIKGKYSSNQCWHRIRILAFDFS